MTVLKVYCDLCKRPVEMDGDIPDMFRVAAHPTHVKRERYRFAFEEICPDCWARLAQAAKAIQQEAEAHA